MHSGVWREELLLALLTAGVGAGGEGDISPGTTKCLITVLNALSHTLLLSNPFLQETAEL